MKMKNMCSTSKLLRVCSKCPRKIYKDFYYYIFSGNDSQTLTLTERLKIGVKIAHPYFVKYSNIKIMFPRHPILLNFSLMKRPMRLKLRHYIPCLFRYHVNFFSASISNTKEGFL